MTATTSYNIVIGQDETFQLLVQWLVNGEAVDLTDYTAEMLVRQHRDDEPIIQLTVGDGISISEDGILIEIPSAETSALSFSSAPWSLIVTSPDDIDTRLLKGRAKLERGV